MTEKAYLSASPCGLSARLSVLGFLFVVISTGAMFSPVFAQDSASQSNSSDMTLRQREVAKQRLRLASLDVEERRDAVLRLGWMNHAESSRIAATALADTAPIVRAIAAHAVLALPSEEAVALLVPLLKDKKEFVRREAAYALGETRSTTAVDALVNVLQGDKQPSVRGAAAVALGVVADERAAYYLARTIDPGFPVAAYDDHKGKKEKDHFVLRSAARSLGQIRSHAPVPALVAALTNERFNDDVRHEAAFSLGLIGDIAAVPALKAAQEAHDPYLSSMAFEALVKIARHDSSVTR